jgi:predicted nucleic acid-binding protein
VYLLDTNVVSELRKLKPHQGVVAWIEKTPEDLLYLSAVTVGEIQARVELTRGSDAVKAAEIEQWLNSLAVSFSILPADAGVFRRWARLMHGRADHHLEDALIAATALVKGFTVVTRNVADFRDFDVPLINPFVAKSLI